MAEKKYITFKDLLKTKAKEKYDAYVHKCLNKYKKLWF